MVLSELPPGRWGVIREIGCEAGLRDRLEDLGMTPGSHLRCLHRAPFGDPSAYEVLGAAIALRRADTDQIELEAPCLPQDR